TTLDFQLPPSLRGLQLDRLRVSVDVNAPDRKFELVALDPNQPKESRLLAEKESPVGLLQFDLVAESLPAINDEQTFRLGFDVGPLAGDVANEGETAEEKSHNWQFRRVWIEAWGKMPE
ncbi:MAG: hypothetical protein KDA84_24490, partial [Planctomycetaceae bacterium]|nr:hypothetical protein [Planctomycetaceae bacterium]